ncbi:MAG: ABA4-like family protein [Pseudomonadota bacterium]
MAFSAGDIFSLGNQIALVGWAILIFLPRRFRVIFWIPQFIIPFLLAMAYAMLIMTSFAEADGNFSSIAGVRALFQSDEALTAGWLHYLAFDLFIGAWIAKRADAAQIPRVIQAVFLLATFMFGPIGLALFLVTRAAMSGTAALSGRL